MVRREFRRPSTPLTHAALASSLLGACGDSTSVSGGEGSGSGSGATSESSESTTVEASASSTTGDTFDFAPWFSSFHFFFFDYVEPGVEWGELFGGFGIFELRADGTATKVNHVACMEPVEEHFRWEYEDERTLRLLPASEGEPLRWFTFDVEAVFVRPGTSCMELQTEAVGIEDPMLSDLALRDWNRGAVCWVVEECDSEELRFLADYCEGEPKSCIE